MSVAVIHQIPVAAGKRWPDGSLKQTELPQLPTDIWQDIFKRVHTGSNCRAVHKEAKALHENLSISEWIAVYKADKLLPQTFGDDMLKTVNKLKLRMSDADNYRILCEMAQKYVSLVRRQIRERVNVTVSNAVLGSGIFNYDMEKTPEVQDKIEKTTFNKRTARFMNLDINAGNVQQFKAFFDHALQHFFDPLKIAKEERSLEPLMDLNKYIITQTVNTMRTVVPDYEHHNNHVDSILILFAERIEKWYSRVRNPLSSMRISNNLRDELFVKAVGASRTMATPKDISVLDENFFISYNSVSLF